MAYELTLTCSRCVQTTTRGRVQLTSKVFNFTDRQDLKLTAGYGHRRKDISSEFIKVGDSKTMVPCEASWHP